ncbi:MAG: penicillin acylase family protein, partial [bacterium]|nr:penicillin acylase family protein [bacterium]
GDILRTQTRIEEIGIKGADSFLDTVLYTVHGPVVKLRNEEIFGNNIPVDCSMRWTGHDASNDLLTFLKLNSAKNYDDYFDALSHFDTPAQNFVFASIDGDIAITHNGKFPLRWKSQGRYILDGSDPAYDWQGWIPREHLPLIRNPERGFVSSANQFPADPAYPYYLGWYYASYVRGARINDVLGKLQSASPEDMMNLHKDVLDIRAETVLPVLLGMIEIADLTEAESEAFEALS